MRKAAAGVSMGTYSAWESTVTLRLLGGARGTWAPTGGEGRGYIVSPRAQLVKQAVRDAATIFPRSLWPFELESGVRVMCDVGYLYANFGLPRPLCSRLRSDVCNRRQTKASLNAPPPLLGAGHNKDKGWQAGITMELGLCWDYGETLQCWLFLWHLMSVKCWYIDTDKPVCQLGGQCCSNCIPDTCAV